MARFALTVLLCCVGGADISWLSAFPGEKEVLFPPLTYLDPSGREQEFGQSTVVEVTPTLA